MIYFPDIHIHKSYLSFARSSILLPTVLDAEEGRAADLIVVVVVAGLAVILGPVVVVGTGVVVVVGTGVVDVFSLVVVFFICFTETRAEKPLQCR